MVVGMLFLALRTGELLKEAKHFLEDAVSNLILGNSSSKSSGINGTQVEKSMMLSHCCIGVCTVCTCIYMYIPMRVTCMYVCMYVCMYLCMYVCR